MESDLSVDSDSSNRTVLFLLKRVDCNDGVASHLETLVSGLKARGWRIILATGPVYEKQAAQTRFNAIRSSVHDWIILDQFMDKNTYVRTNSTILEIVRKYDVQILHALGLSLLPHAAVLRIRSQRKIVATFVPSIHSNDPKSLKTSLSKFQVLKYAIILHTCRPDAVIAISIEIFRLFAGLCKYPAVRVPKILLGVDTSHFRPPKPSERDAARLKLGLDPNDIAIALPGRLNWNKGHDLMISAAAELRQKRSDVSIRFIFPGTGYQAEDIKRVARESSSDERTFVFTGYVDDMRSIYFAADIAVLPSRHEGFPLVVVEAMACGLPVIRTPTSGIEDQIVDGVNGFRVPFNDVSALVAKIDILLEKTVRQKMGAAALEHSKQFDRNKMTTDTETLYTKLILG